MKRQSKGWHIIFILGFFLIPMALILFSPVYLCEWAAAQDTQDMVHLGLVGEWSSDYGEVNAIKVWQHEEVREGEKQVVWANYACCATSRGIEDLWFLSSLLVSVRI